MFYSPLFGFFISYFLSSVFFYFRYVEEIEASAKKVEEFNEQRGERLNRVKVVEKELENLEGAKLEAEVIF